MLQITENEILEAFDKFELSEEELIELYSEGYISENTMNQLIEMGIFDELIMESEEDLVLEEEQAEELEEGKITRGIREVGHQAVKHIIQPLLSRNYKRDAYAHELKHVRRQLNDAKREGDSKAIEKLKNRAASISKKGDNAGFGYVHMSAHGKTPSRFTVHSSAKNNNVLGSKYDVSVEKSIYDIARPNIYKNGGERYKGIVDKVGRLEHDKHFRIGNRYKLMNDIHKEAEKRGIKS